MKLELFWWDYPGKNLRERPVIVLSSFVTRTTDPIRPFTKGKKKRKLHSIENRNIDRVVGWKAGGGIEHTDLHLITVLNSCQT